MLGRARSCGCSPSAAPHRADAPSPVRIAISTGGGDAPGLNAVIRAAVLSATARRWEVLGIKRGFGGLLGDDEVVLLTRDSVRGIAHDRQ